jgi:hypothetical protein
MVHSLYECEAITVFVTISWEKHQQIEISSQYCALKFGMGVNYISLYMWKKVFLIYILIKMPDL